MFLVLDLMRPQVRKGSKAQKIDQAVRGQIVYLICMSYPTAVLARQFMWKLIKVNIYHTYRSNIFSI